MATVTDVSSSAYAPDDLIPIGDAARILGVSIDTMRRWDRTGKLVAVRTLGGQRRFRRSDVEALVKPVKVAS